MRDLADALAGQTAPLNSDMIHLDESLDAMVSFGFRVFTPENTARFRVLRRMRGWYFGPEGTSTQVQYRSLSLLRRPSDLGAFIASRSNLAGLVMRAARRGIGFSHPFALESIAPYVGSTWFGCRREIAQRFLARPADGALEKFCGTLHACDEIYLPTALRMQGTELAPSNHFVSRFEGQHPKTIAVDDLPAAFASGRFFARKFSNDPRDPARQRVLQTLQAHDFPAEVAVDDSQAT